MSTDTSQQYWFLAGTSPDAKLPLIATGVGSSLGAGAGQDLTSEEYVGPQPYLTMSAEAESHIGPVAMVQAFLYRAISWIPSIRIAQALHGTGQDLSSTSGTPDWTVNQVSQKVSQATNAVKAGASKIVSSATSGLMKILLMVVVVAVAVLFLMSFVQAKGMKAGGVA